MKQTEHTETDLWRASYLQALGIPLLRTELGVRGRVLFIFTADEGVSLALDEFAVGDANINVRQLMNAYEDLRKRIRDRQQAQRASSYQQVREIEPDATS